MCARIILASSLALLIASLGGCPPSEVSSDALSQLTGTTDQTANNTVSATSQDSTTQDTSGSTTTSSDGSSSGRTSTPASGSSGNSNQQSSGTGSQNPTGDQTNQGNQGSQTAAVLAGDLNCDGVVNRLDVNAFAVALGDPAGYAAQFPNCNRMLADTNGDGVINFGDIDAFVTAVLAAQ